jgi:hypothetical protein
MNWFQQLQALLHLILAKAEMCLRGNGRIEKAINELTVQVNLLEESVSLLANSQSTCCAQLNTELQQIIGILTPSPPVAFNATVTANQQGDIFMTPSFKKSAKASADLQVADNGTFTVTLGFVDADGIATPTPSGLSATYTASDATPGPSSLTLTPSADTSSCAGAVNQTTIQALIAAGSPLPTGLTVSVTATWTGLASPLTVSASPAIDIVAGPANSFVAVDSEP